MGYIKALEKYVIAKEESNNQDDFDVLELLIEMDTTFKQTRDSIVRAVRQLDQKHPGVGDTEILAALMNESIKILFPNIHLEEE